MKSAVIASIVIGLFLFTGILVAGEAASGEAATTVAPENIQPPLPTVSDETAQAVKDTVKEIAPNWLRDTAVLMANWQWVALFVLIVASFIIGRIVRFIIGKWLQRWMKKRELKNRPPIPQSVYENAERPFDLLVTALILLLLYPFLLLPTSIYVVVSVATKIILAVSGVWAIFRIADLISELFQQMASRTENKLDDLLVPMVRRIIKVFVTIFGGLFIAQNLNVNVTSLLAGLGLGGLAFALAAKDTVANLFGSLTILVDQPFRIGDWVVIGGAEGTVEDVGFRTTRIRTFYNSVISLPNSKIVDTQVDNLGLRVYRRCNCMLSITYSTPPERIEAFCEGIRELIRLHPYTRKDYFNVYFNALAASSLDIMLYVFWKVPNWPTELQEKQRLFIDIMRLAQRLGIDFAFPTQTLHIESVPNELTSLLGGGKQMSLFKGAAGKEKAVDIPPLLTAEDMEKALETGRELARELVKATLGDPIQVPPPSPGN
ncbi:MAG: mechanosensitive ion channel family protein [Planctomycetes bacterium]|nr:mechanosensitive ion channel family protein [Planctomycetota bacterium]